MNVVHICWVARAAQPSPVVAAAATYFRIPHSECRLHRNSQKPSPSLSISVVGDLLQLCVVCKLPIDLAIFLRLCVCVWSLSTARTMTTFSTVNETRSADPILLSERHRRQCMGQASRRSSRSVCCSSIDGKTQSQYIGTMSVRLRETVLPLSRIVVVLIIELTQLRAERRRIYRFIQTILSIYSNDIDDCCCCYYLCCFWWGGDRPEIKSGHLIWLCRSEATKGGGVRRPKSTIAYIQKGWWLVNNALAC